MSLARIIHGDCRDVLPTLRLDGCVVITDPPWPSGGKLDVVGCGDAAVDLWASLAPLLVTARAVVIAQSSMDAPLPGPPGMPFLQVCWLRILPINYRGHRLLNHIAYVYGDPPRPPGKHIWSTECYSCNPESMKRRRSSNHPCPFSLDHARWLVRWFAHGCTVIDPFAGSGVFLQAAAELGQPSIGIEVDERWIPDSERLIRKAENQGLLQLYPAKG